MIDRLYVKTQPGDYSFTLSQSQNKTCSGIAMDRYAQLCILYNKTDCYRS